MLKKANGDLSVVMKEVGTKKMPKDSPIPFRRHATVTWRGKGEQALTTVIAPREASFDVDGQASLTANARLVEGPGLSGFDMALADGTRVQYRAACRAAALVAGDVTAEARVLLVSGDRGVALDCSRIAFAGVSQTPAHPDFEFVLTGGGLRLGQPIYRPIQPVTIEPDANVFVDRATVSLACPPRASRSGIRSTAACRHTCPLSTPDPSRSTRPPG